MFKTTSRRSILLLLFAAILFGLTFVLDEFRIYQGAQVSYFIVGIAAITLLTGYSGQISLGHGALMAVGAYAAVLSQTHWHLQLWLTFVIAVLATALAGVILGSVAARLSGPYLAGTTLAFAVGLPALANQFGFLGGEQGLGFDIGMPPMWLGEGFTPYKWTFVITGSAAILTMWAASNIVRSRYGRTWRAIRANPTSSALAGIPVARTQILAFTISAGLAGMAGALMAATIGLVTPSNFPLAISFSLLTGAVISGVTSLLGTMLGALVLVAIPSLTDSLAERFGGGDAITSNLPGLMTSVLLIVTVLFSPNGPAEQWRSAKRKREMHKVLTHPSQRTEGNT